MMEIAFFVVGSVAGAITVYLVAAKTMYALNPVTQTFVEIDPTQVWFWKREWIGEEMQAERELRSGNYEEFDSMDDFIDSL